MIPVVWNGSSWVKADKENANNNWYDYENQKWANVVTIKDTAKRTTYKNAAVGTTIDLSDVNLMLVWIPRYSYTLRDKYGYQIDGASPLSINTPGAFNIKFVNTNTIEKGSGKYSGDKPMNYYTPSSFCWGNSCDVESTRGSSENKELPGIWISKFELTGTKEDITSLPNQKSFTLVNNYTFFNAIQTQMNGDTGTTKYGFAGTNYDTHMIKSTEWGAMAYLSQSKYGKYGNDDYKNENKEIYINDYNGKLSGCSKGAPGSGEYNVSNSSSTCYKYNEEKNGTGASTTGTIYGIYDTSGGAYDNLMGFYNKGVGVSGFTEMPAAKYYNLYTNGVGIKGDATNADGTAGFYGDTNGVLNTGTWLCTSGNYISGTVAGIFFYAHTSGSGYSDQGTRSVISIWQ